MWNIVTYHQVLPANHSNVLIVYNWQAWKRLVLVFELVSKFKKQWTKTINTLIIKTLKNQKTSSRKKQSFTGVVQIAVMKNFVKFTEKHLQWVLSSVKLHSIVRFHRTCFFVNFGRFCRKPPGGWFCRGKCRSLDI